MKTQFLMLVLIISFAATKIRAQVPCLTNAENALNENRYLEVISYANSCIQSFRLQAVRIQHRLDSLHITVPDPGAVTDEQRREIFQNGVLNDVATVCFYKGKAAEALYDKNHTRNLRYRQMAIDAFTLALKFKKGRHWDPKGFFWSPSEAAQDQLSELRN